MGLRRGGGAVRCCGLSRARHREPGMPRMAGVEFELFGGRISGLHGAQPWRGEVGGNDFRKLKTSAGRQFKLALAVFCPGLGHSFCRLVGCLVVWRGEGTPESWGETLAPESCAVGGWGVALLQLVSFSLPSGTVAC